MAQPYNARQEPYAENQQVNSCRRSQAWPSRPIRAGFAGQPQAVQLGTARTASQAGWHSQASPSWPSYIGFIKQAWLSLLGLARLAWAGQRRAPA